MRNLLLFTCLLLWSLAPCATFADPPQSSSPVPAVLAAGDHASLWVVTQQADKFQLLYRNPQSPASALFVALEAKGKVASLAAGQSLAYLLYDNHLFQSIRFIPKTDTHLPAFDIQQLPPLPPATNPLQINASSAGLLVLALAPPAGSSDSPAPADTNIFKSPDGDDWWFNTPTPAPQTPKPPDNSTASPAPPASALTIFQFTHTQWQRIPAPVSEPSANLRIVAFRGRPAILQLADHSLTIHQYDGSQWSNQSFELTVSTDFRALTVDNHLVLIDRTPTPAGDGLQLVAHLFFDGQFRPAGLIPLPPGRRLDFLPTAYDDQLSVVLAAPAPNPAPGTSTPRQSQSSSAASGSSAPNAWPSLSLVQRDLRAAPDTPVSSTDLKITQWPTPPINRDLLVFAFIAVAMLIMMAVWRRDASGNAVKLPSTLVPAELTRRALALLIDLIPAWVILYLMAGFTNPDALLQHLPNYADLSQWLAMLLLVAVMTLHVTLCEMFTGRSLGKLITGLRVVTITGQSPNLWQILTRNLIRILELPPLVWPLMMIPALNPARQRLGDMAARTVVVRIAKPGETTLEKHPNSNE